MKSHYGNGSSTKSSSSKKKGKVKGKEVSADELQKAPDASEREKRASVKKKTSS